MYRLVFFIHIKLIYVSVFYCYSDSSRMDHTKEEFVGILQDNKRNMTVKQEGQKFQQYICAFIGTYDRK